MSEDTVHYDQAELTAARVAFKDALNPSAELTQQDSQNVSGVRK